MRPISRTEEHVGEWKISLAADSIEEVFAEMARVIARTAGTTGSRPAEWERVHVRARDMATLLADWANELLGRSDASGLAYGEVRAIDIQRSGSDDVALRAEVRGMRIDRWVSPLKAATYHGLSLVRDGARWRAVILMDV